MTKVFTAKIQKPNSELCFSSYFTHFEVQIMVQRFAAAFLLLKFVLTILLIKVVMAKMCVIRTWVDREAKSRAEVTAEERESRIQYMRIYLKIVKRLNTFY
jgi:hypothetical protein